MTRSIRRYMNILTGRRPTKKRGYRGGKKHHGSAAPNMFVPTFLHMLNTVKLYHWKTTSFQRIKRPTNFMRN